MPPKKARVATIPAGWSRRLVEVGTQSATFIIIPLAREKAQQLLPAELQLVPCDVAGADKHPLMCAFGRQRDVHSTFPLPPGCDSRQIADHFAALRTHPHLLPLAMNYREVIAAIPFVTWRNPQSDCAGPFLFAPRLYLDKFLPTFIGWLVGLAKEVATIDGDKTGMNVNGLLDDKCRFRGEAAPRGRTGTPSTFPHFQQIRPMFELPLLGKTCDGIFVRSRFVFELDQARLRAAPATVRLTRRFFDGTLREICHAADGIDVAALGAFCLDVPWQASDPVVCLPV